MEIAFDAGTDGGFSTGINSLSWNHTCTGTDRALFVGVFGDLLSNDPTGNHIAGVSYNAVIMTEIGRIVEDNGSSSGAQRWVYLFGLPAPASGTNQVFVAATAFIAIGGISLSYTGVSAPGFPDASATAYANATSVTSTVTAVANPVWSVAVFKNSSGGTVTGGTGTTIRVDNTTDGLSMGDSNGNVSGTTSLIASLSGSAFWGSVIATMAEAGATGTTWPGYQSPFGWC